MAEYGSGYWGKSQADRNLNKRAAKLAYKRPELRAAAEKVLEKIKTVAAESEKTSGYVDSLDIVQTPKKDVQDFRIISRHPAALAIEYGHLSGTSEPEGPLREGEERKGRKWVMGKFYMTRAGQMIAEGK